MSTTAQLRAVVVGLIAFAAAEEETLLASAASDVADPGNERRWAAVPTVAHNTEFKAQQAERITAVLAGCAPPTFGEIDHRPPPFTGGTPPGPRLPWSASLARSPRLLSTAR